MQFNNSNFGKESEPFRFSPFNYTADFGSSNPPVGSVMITETGDFMITESTNDNMIIE